MKTKNILVVLGSPRKNGNSAILAQQISKGAKSEKAEVETIYLQEKNIAPCRACMSCQKKGSRGCSIRDDMQEIYAKLIKADAWVIASPVYWFTMSAQTKLFMDRCFALPAYHSDPFRGKRIAVAMAYGDEDAVRSGCINALRTFQDAFRFTGSSLVGMVYGSAMDAGEIRLNEKLMRDAYDLGKMLATKQVLSRT
ncbi:MAG: flavodoxin family protein [Smithellaceae bacterium]|nr:flavodoxin family protein [Smithellaceae bacterium]